MIDVVRRLFVFLLAPLALFACGPRDAEESPEPAPAAPAEEAAEPRALDAAALAELDATLERLAAERARAGYAAVIALDGEIVHVSEAGYADIAAGRPMTADTPVRIASMTKPVTAVAVMMLVEDGALSLDDPVADYIPAFADARVATSFMRNEAMEIPTEPLERAITIRDLITHTSGVGYIFDYDTNLGALYIGHDIYQGDAPMAARMETLAGLPLYFQPGEAWRYSYANDVLGHVVEIVSGETLDAFMDARIFTPLGMDDTTFFPGESLRARMAALYTHDDDGALVRVPAADDGVLNAADEAGGAGLVSTAHDYMRFALMLAGGGELDGTRLLSAETVDRMTELHVGPERTPDSMDAADTGYGLGVGVAYDGDDETIERPGDFGWGGYFDTDFFVSPSTGLAGVIMAQEEPGPTTPPEAAARAVFKPLAYGALPGE
ncbi:serine hydrolase [Marinicauda salina]|uniref:Serine hydrolase n=1 Tax=Marinicauda salina TaxID=2135793 RepID=A0A2U2BRK9_9PROT|nr:serine hydrolase domain-containing protein [Marinicauda salina]PWE16642.1 serine hydrolase [Marinicauda salina]